MLTSEMLSEMLQLPTYQLKRGPLKGVTYRFTAREQAILETIAAIASISKEPQPTVMWQIIGREEYEKLSARCNESMEYAQRGYLIEGITLEDYDIPLDDTI